MKKIAIVSAFLLSGFLASAQTIYKGTDETVVSFFSHTSMEDIDGKSKIVTAALKAEDGTVVCQLANKSFHFHSGLMEEHFNENYIESEKYKNSTLKGKVVEKVDYSKDGVNNVTIEGTMDIHGVQKPVKVPATLTVKGDQITVDAKFPIVYKDYNVTIPTAVATKFSESVEVTVKAVLKKMAK
ncbi:MAG: YceI family protein [Bacteroidia bacterium]